MSGAVLGACVWACLDELGVWSALKTDLYVGPLALALVIGAAAGAVPSLRTALWASAGLAVLIVVIVAFTPIAGALARPLVRVDPSAGKTYDAVVVLSGGATADSVMSSHTLDRLIRGVEVTRQSAGSALVLSRESPLHDSRTASDSADQASVLALLGVTAPVYFIDSATSTRDEAVRLRALNRERAWKRIALVTSPLHSRRACATFEKVGFAVTCIPSAARDAAIRNLRRAEERLRVFRGWFYEMAGTADYRLHGWI